MAYNFKSIADVEVVAEPSESANVLIEEDGVIKKTPKTAVGGAGDNNYDAIIEVIAGSSGYFQSVDLLSYNYQSLKDKILSCIFPNVIIKYIGSEGYGMKGEGLCRIFGAMITEYGDEECICIMFESLNYTTKQILICADGTISY